MSLKDGPATPVHTIGFLNIRTGLAVGGVIALLGFLTWGLINKGESGLAIGDPVPTRALTTLPEGEQTSLADYKGQWVLLNVWASWCIPCRKESPALDEFEKKHGGQVTVLGVDTRDLSEDGEKFIKEFKIEYAQARDASGYYADDLKTTGVPESFLVDPDGNLVAHYPGPFADLNGVEQFAAPALQANANVDPAGSDKKAGSQ